jgi:hypothetical protein
MKTVLIAAALVVGVTAAHADGYHKASGFEQTKAYCELVANGLQTSGGFVMGSPAFVGGAMLGSAIGGAIRHAQNYDSRMVLKGYAKNQ